MEKVLIAAISFISAILAAGLTLWGKWWLEKKQNNRDAKYLAIRVVCILDTFIYDCFKVVNDDGTVQGQYPPDGPELQTTTPNLNFDALEVNWNSIPTDIMHRILSLPNKIDAANCSIGCTWEHVGIDDAICDRQLEYSKLGLEAYDIIKDLCQEFDVNINLFKDRSYAIEGIRQFRIEFLNREIQFRKMTPPKLPQFGL